MITLKTHQSLVVTAFIILNMSFATHPFSYDSVIYTAQNGDIKAADQQMRSIVVNSPDDADVLYDAGVLAHQLNNYSQAAAYFNRAAQCAADQDKDLCFRAHFNAGNAYVDNKDLKLALEHYEEALGINSENEYARHNRDRVAQMLQEQEQQKNNEQKNDPQDQKDDKNQQDKNEQNKDDQSGDKNDQQENNNDDQQQENDQQQSNDSQKNGSDQKSKGKQGKGSDQDSKREQGTEQGDTDKDQRNAGNDEKRNREQELDKKSERAQNEREKQQGKQHEKAPQEEKKENKTKSQDSIPSDGKQEQQKNASKADAQQAEAGIAEGEQDESQKWDQTIDDPWLRGILDNQELQDKAVNKKLMVNGSKNSSTWWKKWSKLLVKFWCFF
jgi:Ca-activated chloride channel family protein